MTLLKQIDTLKILTFAVKAFFIGAFFCCLAATTLVVLWSYETFTFQLLDYYGKTDKLEIFRSDYLSFEKYMGLRIALFVALLFWTNVLLKLNRFSNTLAKESLSFLRSLKAGSAFITEGYRSLSSSRKILVLLTLVFIGSVKWFFMERYFFHIDEIFSYLFFVRKGFFVIVSYYPGSNNHIFYSLIVYVLQPFFSNPFYLMKVPSLMLSLVASFLAFLFMVRYFKFSSALIGTLLFSFSGHFFFYSIFGRGYVLVSLFVILSAFMILEIISGKSEKFFWYCYTISSILGFYSMIVYIYPYLSFTLALLVFMVYQKRYVLLKDILLYNSIVVIGVLILYTPIFFINGISNLISNPWTIKYEWLDFLRALPSILAGSMNYIIDFENNAFWIGTALLTSAFFVLIKTKRIPLFILLFTLFTAPILALAIQRVQTFDRVWTYLIFPYALAMVVLLDVFFSRIEQMKYVPWITTTMIAMGITGYTIYYFNQNTNHGHTIYDQVGRISREVAAKAKGKVYTNEDVYNIYLRYEASQLGKELVPVMSAPTNSDWYSDVLILPGSAFPSQMNKNNYLLKERNEYIEVYKWKE